MYVKGSILTSDWILTSAKCCTFMGCAENTNGCDQNKNRITTGKQKVSFDTLFFEDEQDRIFIATTRVSASSKWSFFKY